MDFAAEHRAQDDLTVVQVRGELDVFSSPRLREMLLDLVEEGGLHLVVDLSDVTFLDSTGLGVLVGIYHRLRARGGSLTFGGANDRVRRVFHVTQLTKIFVLHDSVGAALKARGADPQTLP